MDGQSLISSDVLVRSANDATREVAGEVQKRVVEYLERMANVVPASIGVVVDSIAPPARHEWE